MKNPIIYEGRLAERLPTNPSRPNSERREKIELIFIFTLLCGASKGFTKAFKAFIKPFEAPQRSVKIKI